MICSIVPLPYKYNYCILFKGLPYMYVTINYNMYTICIRNTARSKSIPLLCTHVYSYMFSTVHPQRLYRSERITWWCLFVLESTFDLSCNLSSWKKIWKKILVFSKMFVKRNFLAAELTDITRDHETMSIVCHVGFHVRLCICDVKFTCKFTCDCQNWVQTQHIEIQQTM